MPPRFASQFDSARSSCRDVHPRAFSRWLIVLLLGVAIPFVMDPGPAAGAGEPHTPGFREKQRNGTEPIGITRPVGLAYAGDADLFIVLSAPGGGTGPTTGASAGLMDRFHQPVGTLALPAGHTNPRAVAYDRNGERLLVLDVASRSLHAIPGGADGTFASERASRLEAPRVGPMRSVGMTVDPVTGEVFVLDRLLRRIVRFTPAAADAGAGALATVPEARTIALGPLASLDLSGLAFDPVSGHLFTLDPARRMLHELDVNGTQVASYDVSAARLSDPQSMVFAPSGDQTDDPAMLSLFVADAGAPDRRRGHVIELAWTDAIYADALTGDAGTLAVAAATLVRVTKTSLYSPPSPDPSGVGYDAVTGRLVISDAEVEEMPIYAGKNVFEASLNGTLVRSWTTLPWDIEPTGTAPNPNNRHLFITNDDADRLWEVNPGPDNVVGTADDTRTSFKTSGFGSGDPEGVAYDPVGNRLFIADGVNEEIYVVRAGPNGVFNGAGSDDIITHFDTHSMGAVDPETVEWKSDTGTLLVLGSTGTKIVREVTTTGTVIANTDISFAPLSKPAGLAYAPSSGGGGWSYYIVTRGVDNNSDPKENDGTLVEISVGGAAPANTAPSTSAGPDQTITLPAQASLDGTVSDDGLPSPPTLTTTWSKVSGPGSVTFGNAGAVDTQASFSVAGVYVLKLTASDGQLSSSDQMQVTAQAAGSNAAPVVSAGPDLSVTLPGQASLDGTVSDDGLPSPPTLTTTWAKVSGPGTVTFVNANAVDTQASFSTTGTYVLSLTASDGQLSTTDQVQITVLAAGSGMEFRIASGSDDVEESATGSVYTNSSDLELVFDKNNQTVGLRFVGVTIPKDATIATAYIQFQADEAQSEVTNLTIQGQAADNAASFSTTSGSVSSRPRTTAATIWSPAAWTTGQAGANQRTPELRGVIQEIVNRPGWASGNALAIIVTGTGHRTAESYEGSAPAAALLHIELGGGGSNTAPTVNAGPDQTITLPAQAALDGTVGDDGLPSPPSLTTVWSVVSGPGPVTFGNANAVDTQASFTTAGSYTLRLTANDGELMTTDQVQITVQPPAGNTAPVVNAGPDLTTTLASQAVLDGTVTDDGLPVPSTLTTTWAKVSGPGTVTFQDANAVDTQASFSLIGTYVLRLTASDGELSASDQTQITVSAGATILRRIDVGTDDAEELAAGRVYNNSTDLELVFDHDNQTVGLRFTSLAIPRGATIGSAFIQFKADEAQSEATSLLIQGQAAGDPATFDRTKTSISTRPRTAASVTWTPAPWTTVGDAGADQRTPDIKAIIQEIVNRSDWVSGGSIVILITGTGHRTAESYEGMPSGAAELEVQYQ